MAGNVGEWCSDNKERPRHLRNRPCLTATISKKVISPRERFVFRGGVWVIDFPGGMRMAFRRFAGAAGLQYNVYSFRIVRR